MAQHGKRYTAAREKIDREHAYTPLEAVRLVKDAPDAKFDETVEAHFNLGLNVRHADQQLRGTLMLPHGTGKDVRDRRLRRGREGSRGGGGGRRRGRRPPTSPRRSRAASTTSTSPSPRRT